MYGTERSYSVGRFFSVVLEFVGLFLLVIGIFWALLGFNSGGWIGIVGREFAGANPPELLRLYAMLPGLTTAIFGAIFIVRGQTAKATLDQSVLMNEMLRKMTDDGEFNRKMLAHLKNVEV